MNSKQKKKLTFISSPIVLLAIASSLVLYALKQNINLYYTPTQALQQNIPSTQTIRLGGFVAANSLVINKQTLAVQFSITDYHTQIPITYQGELPNLFREQQGVVITGHFDANHQFVATEILAKHDEKYMPKPVQELLKTQSGDNHAG